VAGLKAAADLATKGYDVTILEARDRVGGRVWTLNTPGGPVEMGAQWCARSCCCRCCPPSTRRRKTAK
jgi:monoamine oxidase